MDTAAHDDLSDVILEGRTLVSDNPQDWKLPRSMHSQQNVLEWWRELIAADQPLEAEKRDRILSAIKAYDYAYAYDRNKLVDQHRLQDALERFLNEGLSIAQTAVLVRTTPLDVMRMLWPNEPSMTPEKRQLMLAAEVMLRAGLGRTEVARQLGLTRDEVQNWAERLNIAPPVEYIDRAGRHFLNPSVKERALRLLDKGMTAPEVLAILCEQPEAEGLKLNTIYQWAHRRRREQLPA